MICRACKKQDHAACVDAHLFDTGRTGCPCQHRTGGFSTSTLNSDGTRREGVYGATGARGSALKLSTHDEWREMIAKAVAEHGLTISDLLPQFNTEEKA